MEECHYKTLRNTPDDVYPYAGLFRAGIFRIFYCPEKPTSTVTLLNNVLHHLLANALKHVPLGAIPRIEISGERRHNYIRMSIKDNGIGIPKDQHEKIFGAFQRLNYSGSVSGTGIGLAIVKKGIERMGGSAGLDSEPGQGSRFWIELPVR